MSWAYCGTDNRGREIGYGIVATCDRKGCDEVINRGLGCICGTMHNAGPVYSDEEPYPTGCGRYFCDKHLGFAGPRGGCSHRFRGAYGQTVCQPMRDDATSKVWCACHLDHYVEWPETEAHHHGPNVTEAEHCPVCIARDASA